MGCPGYKKDPHRRLTAHLPELSSLTAVLFIWRTSFSPATTGGTTGKTGSKVNKPLLNFNCFIHLFRGKKGITVFTENIVKNIKLN